MNTHLSEASVNSLLTLVKGANTSRSYDDKINILTKAGVLPGAGGVYKVPSAVPTISLTPKTIQDNTIYSGTLSTSTLQSPSLSSTIPTHYGIVFSINNNNQIVSNKPITYSMCAGSFTILVNGTDNGAIIDQTFTITVLPPITLTPTTIQDNTVYSGTLSTSSLQNVILSTSLSVVVFSFQNNNQIVSSIPISYSMLSEYDGLFTITIQAIDNGAIINQTFPITVLRPNNLEDVALTPSDIANIELLIRLNAVLKSIKQQLPTQNLTLEYFMEQVKTLVNDKPVSKIFKELLLKEAHARDLSSETLVYSRAVAYAINTGLSQLLDFLFALQSNSVRVGDELITVGDVLTTFERFTGGILWDLIKQGPNYLSTILDGTYNFIVYPQSTTQPSILTGTAVITSQKNRYTGTLVQKLINNKIVGTPPITALQTLDASYNSRQIDTSGSSSTGKYTVAGNTATITSNGYSKASGAFVETVTTITTYPAGFFVNNSIINLDNNSYTPISLTIYTRQLTSAELAWLVSGAFDDADISGDEFISREKAEQILKTRMDTIYSTLQTIYSTIQTIYSTIQG
jgi:hypothetical protein